MRGTLSRAFVAFFVAAALMAGGSACGEEEAQSLTFEVGPSGEITGPSSAEAGLAEITLDNGGKGEADLQLIRAEAGRTAEDVVEGLSKAIKGEPFPSWFFAGGGIGAIRAGENRTVTQVLEPGTYYAFNTEGDGPPDPKSVPEIKVSGEASADELGEGDATVSAVDYGFETEELPAGRVEVAFENSGEEPHHLIASPIVGDSTAKDVESFFKTEKGKPPLQEKGTQATAVLEGGESQLVTLDLKPGRYALYCFITDREGGPPHVFKGMVDEVEVR